MSYSKCGLCLKDLEVIRPASGIPYIRCPFFCREDSIHSYQECLFNRVIPEYKVHEGGDVAVQLFHWLRVSLYSMYAKL